MSHPLVVRLDREKYDVDISRKTKWGNPFTHLPMERTSASFQVVDRHDAVQCFHDWIEGKPAIFGRFPELKLWKWQTKRALIRDGLASGELADKRLGCHCAPDECHGDVLAEIANEGDMGLVGSNAPVVGCIQRICHKCKGPAYFQPKNLVLAERGKWRLYCLLCAIREGMKCETMLHRGEVKKPTTNAELLGYAVDLERGRN